ncbi:MAG TPA: hypothetical protein PL110_11890 [Candidatus Eremiobacteraeota bacterium]|nr:hypothetical protein [Candidatus Eremiobacteraeota bacterium]
MVKIIDFLKGKVVIDEIEREFVEKEMIQYIAVEYEEDLPEVFWLSSDAMEELQALEIKDEKLKKFLDILVDYVINNSEFIDADGDMEEGINEKGCYLAFQFIKKDPEFKISGFIRQDMEPVTGIRVKVYDDDVFTEDFLGLAFSDVNGYYEVGFNLEDFVNLDSDAIPELYLDIAELDRVTGDFNSIQQIEIPKTKENVISYDVEL